MNMKNIKKKLEEQKKELRSLLERFADEDEKPTGDWDTKFPHHNEGSLDLEEAADEVEEFESLRSIEHALELKLKKTNAALKKMEKGGYGICDKCNKEINKKRLELVPEADLCKSCSD